MNYFELFDLPVKLNPDILQVKNKYLQLSREYHPDFFTQKSESEQAEALDMSSLVNKGYKTLSNKDESIKYVLQLKGLLEEEEKYQLPSDFLMEMLELNEQMMEAKMEDDEESKTKLKQQLQTIENEIYEPVKDIVENYIDGETGNESLMKVKDYYYKKKYIDRILATFS